MSQLEFVAGGGGFGVLPHYMVENDDRFIKVMPEQFSFTRSYWLLIPIELNRLFSVRALTENIISLVRKKRLLFCPDFIKKSPRFSQEGQNAGIRCLYQHSVPGVNGHGKQVHVFSQMHSCLLSDPR